MTMPRLSLYRPNRTNDYQFFDRTIKEMFTVGGLDIYVHKYLGPIVDPEQANNPGDATLPVYDSTNPLYIEDLLLLENRDRTYDPDVYVMRGVYRTQDIDFDLTQFGLFLNGDTLFISFHYNNMIDTFGRKLMVGDVIEVPNLKDYHPLNRAIPNALPRYYVIQDGNYSSEGFSQTWLPHVWRVKATPMVNAQEYSQIINQPFMPENIWDPGNFYPGGETVNNGGTYYVAKQNVPPGTDITDTDYWQPVTTPATVGDQMSTRPKDLEINDALLIQAQADVPPRTLRRQAPGRRCPKWPPLPRRPARPRQKQPAPGWPPTSCPHPAPNSQDPQVGRGPGHRELPEPGRLLCASNRSSRARDAVPELQDRIRFPYPPRAGPSPLLCHNGDRSAP